MNKLFQNKTGRGGGEAAPAWAGWGGGLWRSLCRPARRPPDVPIPLPIVPMPGRSFRFALDPVLQLRARAVETARVALSRAVQARAEAQAALERAEAALVAQAEAPPATTHTARSLGGAAVHRVASVWEAADLRRGVERAAAAEARARRALAQTLRAQEALTTLRAEAADAHRARTARAETVALDDLATIRRAA